MAAFVSLCALAAACNVPVFRFALERWHADAYQVVVLHRGPLTDGQRELIKPLQEAEDGRRANLVVRVIEANELDKPVNGKTDEGPSPLAGLRDQVWSRLEAGGAALILQYPPSLRIAKPAWTGPLARAEVAGLLDSPARQELARRLGSGQTAVWILLESGDSAQDDPVAARLEEELKRLEKELKLPELTESPDDKLLSDAPLEIKFSILRVPRKSADEAALVATLIGSEPDLAERNDPMVFPIFGRGRALWALIGPGITAKNIYDSAAFLVGPCSCEVKEQNPGFDLLLFVDWEEKFRDLGIQLTAAPTRATPPPGEKAEPELVPIPAGGNLSSPAPAATETPVPVVPAPVAAAAPAPWPVVTIFSVEPRWVLGGLGAIVVLVVMALVALKQASHQH